MRMLPLLTFSLLAACAPTKDARTPPGGEQTIVSSNPCIDAILVELVDPGRILSISHYSQSVGSSSMDVALARQFPGNGGTAEEIIALRPDVVLLGTHTPPATLEALERAAIKIELIAVPNSIDESLEQIDQIGVAIDAETAAKKLKARIKTAVDNAAVARPARAPKLLIWQAGGLVPGNATLIDDMLQKAGFANASEDYGLAMWDILPLEPVAKNPPEVILTPTKAKSGESRNVHLRQRFFSRFDDQIIKADMTENLLHCGGPTIIRAMELLKGVRADVTRQRAGDGA